MTVYRHSLTLRVINEASALKEGASTLCMRVYVGSPQNADPKNVTVIQGDEAKNIFQTGIQSISYQSRHADIRPLTLIFTEQFPKGVWRTGSPGSAICRLDPSKVEGAVKKTVYLYPEWFFPGHQSEIEVHDGNWEPLG